MRRNLEWIEGAPEKLEAGMVVQWPNNNVHLIGRYDEAISHHDPIDEDYVIALKSIKRWAYAIKPHELKWIEDMVNRSNKSRGEQE